MYNTGPAGNLEVRGRVVFLGSHRLRTPRKARARCVPAQKSQDLARNWGPSMLLYTTTVHLSMGSGKQSGKGLQPRRNILAISISKTARSSASV